MRVITRRTISSTTSSGTAGVTSPKTATQLRVSSLLMPDSHATRASGRLGQRPVQDGIRDLVAHLVGMAFGDTLTAEQQAGMRLERSAQGWSPSDRIRRIGLSTEHLGSDEGGALTHGAQFGSRDARGTCRSVVGAASTARHYQSGRGRDRCQREMAAHAMARPTASNAARSDGSRSAVRCASAISASFCSP